MCECERKMEIEVEGRVKPLAYKVKAISRESPSQKASHVLDADLRSHWSTSTNTKEWILLELNVRTNYSLSLSLSSPLFLSLGFGPISILISCRNLACSLTFGFTTSPFSNGRFPSDCASRSAFLFSFVP